MFGGGGDAAAVEVRSWVGWSESAAAVVGIAWQSEDAVKQGESKTNKMTLCLIDDTCWTGRFCFGGLWLDVALRHID